VADFLTMQLVKAIFARYMYILAASSRFGHKKRRSEDTDKRAFSKLNKSCPRT
jgi:hypothetical protein